MAIGQQSRLLLATLVLSATVHAQVQNATSHKHRNDTAPNFQDRTASNKDKSDMDDDYIGPLDTGAFRRLLYHSTFLGAEIGRSQALRYDPEFEERCQKDVECHLALQGLTSSVTRKHIGMGEPVCPHEHCDAANLVQVWSHKHIAAVQEAFARTWLLAENFGTNSTSPQWDSSSDTNLRVISTTQQWLVKDDVDKKGLERVRSYWAAGDQVQTPLRDWYNNHTLVDSSYNLTDLRGSLFMETLFNGPTCLGDSYLCPVDQAQRDAVIPVLSAMKASYDAGVLHEWNPFRSTISYMRARNSGWKDLDDVLAHSKMKTRHRNEALMIMKRFADEANANRDALRGVSENMIYTTEVFDQFTGRIWHANFRWDDSRTIDPGLRMLGYVPLVAQEDTGMPLLGYESTRHVDDLTPVTAGYWQMITVDPTPAANTVNASMTHEKRSAEIDILAPAGVDWHLPSEGGFVPHPSLLSRRGPKEETKVNPAVPHRLFQVRTGAEGGIMTDSMGNPLTRTVEVDDDHETPPVMQSTDTTIIYGGMLSLMGLKFSTAAGKAIGLGTPLQFAVHAKSALKSNIVRGERHVQFAEFEAVDRIRANNGAGRRSWWPVNREQRVRKRWIKDELRKQQRFTKEWEEELLELGTKINRMTPGDTWLPGLRQRKQAVEKALESSKKTQRAFKDLQNLPKVNPNHPNVEVLTAQRAERVESALEQSRDTFRFRERTRLLEGADLFREVFEPGTAVPEQMRNVADSIAARRGARLSDLMDFGAIRRYIRMGWHRPSPLLHYDRKMPTALGEAQVRAADVVEILASESYRVTEDVAARHSRILSRINELVSSPARARAAARNTLRAVKLPKVPLGAIGNVAMAAFTIGSGIAQLVSELEDDDTCKRPTYRTELWSPEAAEMDIILSPCINTVAPLPTPTNMEPLTVVFGGPEPTGKEAWVLPGGIPYDNVTTHGLASPNATHPNGTQAVIPSNTIEDVNATSTEEFKCPMPPLDQDYMYGRAEALPCPIPTPRECSIDWFRKHINEIPVGVRGPDYCGTGNLVGHARAQANNCLPDFGSKACKKMFGLDEKTIEKDKKKEEERQKKEDKENEKKQKEEERRRKEEEEKKKAEEAKNGPE